MIRNISKEHSKQSDKSWGDLYYHVIPDLINRMGLKRGVELGIAFGGHSKSILEKTNIEKLYGVDYYKESSDSTDNFYWDMVPYSQQDYDNMYEFTNERLSSFGDRFVMIRNTTSLAYDQVNEIVDFIFIDALHTYEGVLGDLEIWYNKVKPGGLISGHDYDHPNFPGVTVAVDEFADSKGCEIIKCEGHVWYFIKNRI